MSLRVLPASGIRRAVAASDAAPNAAGDVADAARAAIGDGDTMIVTVNKTAGGANTYDVEFYILDPMTGVWTMVGDPTVMVGDTNRTYQVAIGGRGRARFFFPRVYGLGAGVVLTIVSQPARTIHSE